MEELSKALDIAVTSARMMYTAEYTNLSSAAAAATAPAESPGSRSQHVGDAVVIELPTIATPLKAGADSGAAASTTNLSQRSQSIAWGKHMPAAPAGAGDNAGAVAGTNPVGGAGAAAGLAAKSPEQLAQMLGGLMMPVQISIARDTWINWKKGALALTPVGWVWDVRCLHPFCVRMLRYVFPW
jgi:hypothetical protein